MQTMTNQELNAMVGRPLVERSGEKIGKVTDVYVDRQTNQPEWLAVATGMFGTKVSFVPLSGIRRGPGGEYQAPFDKEQVKGAPTAEADGALSPAEEAHLYQYYGLAEPAPKAASRQQSSGDDAMTRSEEELRVGTATEQRGHARLRKWVETEHVSKTMPVSHDEVRVVREPITAENRDAAMSGPGITENVHEMTLSEEHLVVGKQTIPKERVRLEKETVTEQRSVEADLRKEHIELEGDQQAPRRR